MTPHLMIFENFYGNPLDVRNFALSQEFNVTGNFPGRRTKPMPEPFFSDTKKLFEKVLQKEISWWPEEYNTSFQYTTQNDETWIHYDPTNWAGVLYLTPNAPLESGTAIYMHKETGISMLNRNNSYTDLNGKSEELNDLSKWNEIIRVSNVFNRLVMYRGEYYHRSVLPGFGDNQYNGRLFQTFFFNTKD